MDRSRHRLEHRDRGLEVALRAKSDADHFNSEGLQNVLVRRKCRLRHDDAIAGIERRKETEHEGSGRPDRDHDLLGIESDTVAAAVVLGDRGAQRGAAQGLGVADRSGVQRAARGIEHARGRAASGLADLQMDDVATGRSKGVGARQHIHGDERCDLAARCDLELSGQRTGSHRFVKVHISSQVLS